MLFVLIVYEDLVRFYVGGSGLKKNRSGSCAGAFPSYTRHDRMPCPRKASGVIAPVREYVGTLELLEIQFCTEEDTTSQHESAYRKRGSYPWLRGLYEE